MVKLMKENENNFGKRLSKIDIENNKDILNLFMDYFRFVEMHQDWTDEQILYSVNSDDIEGMCNYIKKVLSSEIEN